MIGIYKIKSPSGRIYIGQSVDIERRFAEYNNLNNVKYQTKLYRSFLKYGVINHSFKILKECSIGDLNHNERFYQEYYNCVEEGLNCLYVKTEDKPRVISEEYKFKISNSLKLKYASGEIVNPRKGKGVLVNIYDFVGELLYESIDIEEAIVLLNLSNRSVLNNVLRKDRYVSQKKFVIIPNNESYYDFIFNCIKVNDGNYIPIYQIFDNGKVVKCSSSSIYRIKEKLLNSKNYIHYSKKNNSHYTFIGLINAVLDRNN